MEKTYELYFLKGSPAGHAWREGLEDTDRRQAWQAGEVYSTFTWDEAAQGPYKPPYPIFGVREAPPPAKPKPPAK